MEPRILYAKFRKCNMIPIDNIEMSSMTPFSAAACGCGCGCACISDPTHSVSLAGGWWETSNQNQFLDLAPFC